jgi:3-mercaptopyruvate sulfurtransferase SseA
MKTLISIIFILLTAIAASSQTAPTKYKNDSEVPRISLKDAKQAFDDGTAIFVDARNQEAYKENHIKGAINIPVFSTDNYGSLPKGKKVIVYCS